MYKCEVCTKVSQPKQPLLRHVLYRYLSYGYKPNGNGKQQADVRQEVAREIALCTGCRKALDEGVTINQLWADHRKDREEGLATAAVPRAYALRQPVLVGRDVTE